MNNLGMQILKDSEGYDAIAKPDCVGVPTIGIGTVVYPDGAMVKNGDKCTEEQALEWLNFELKDKALTLEGWINNNKLLLSGNSFSALLCFAYNLGLGSIINSGSSMNSALLSKDELKIRNAFGLYVKGYTKILGIRIGKTLPGLVIRRKKEADLFFTQDS